MKKTIGPKFRRAIHYDFHTSPGVKGILANFDAEAFAGQLAAAHVEYINMAARCNMGYSYYQTRVGKKYEGLGDRDPFAEMIAACHKRNIGVTAYLNVSLDHAFAADHHGWLKVFEGGRIYREDKKDNFFRMMCYNSPYRQHFLAEIREICEYDIDGLFCDCFQLSECYCPHCMADMEKRGVDSSDPEAVLAYQNQIRNEFAQEIYEAAGAKKDSIKFFYNSLSWSYPHQTHAEVECLPSCPGWGYDYFDYTAAYTRTLFEDRVYMSGRFQNSWGDFGGIKPVASMENDLYDAMMNSFAISYGDHLHPVDGFEKEVAARIGKVMEQKRLYEPYTENSENLVEVGLLVQPNDQNRRLPDFVKGVARMLKELKVTYNIYDETGCFEADNVKLLILAGEQTFSQEFKERLRKFAATGGKLLFTDGAIALGVELGLLDFVELVGKDNRDNAYFTFPESDMRWAMYAPSRIIRNRGGREIAKYVGNVVNFTWDGRQSCYYRPQGTATEYSAAVLGENAACICFDIFKAYADNFLTEHRDLLKKLLDALLPEPLIDAIRMPKTATVALTQTAEHTVFHVKSTYPEHKMSRGIIEEHTYMKSVPVSVLGSWRVFRLPERTAVDSHVENGRTIFETGDILGYGAFLLQKI